MLWGIAIVGWLILLIRPSYGLVGLLSVVVLAASTVISGASDIYYALGAATVHAAGFALIGAIIVSFRGDRAAAKANKNLDKEMQRIRAEIAARDGGGPPANGV